MSKVNKFVVWDNDTFPKACYVKRWVGKGKYEMHNLDIVTSEQLEGAREATHKEIWEAIQIEEFEK